MSSVIEKIKQFVGVSFWDSLYKTFTFRDFFIATFPACMNRRIAKVRKAQSRKLEDLKQQKSCRVVFFLQTHSVWKYDALYQKLAESEYFEPIVVISPYNVHLIYDKEECFRVMRQTEDFARAKG